jgi:hypothetical protein
VRGLTPDANCIARTEGLGLHSLSADDAAEYLWRRFSSDLER